MIFDENNECMPASEKKALQLDRLKWVTKWVYDRVPHYKKKFDELKVKPEDIKSLDDIQRLPFTSKDDLRENYPFQMFARDMKDIVRIHSSSGTTGKPTVVGYVKEDIKTWSEVTARTLCCCGGDPGTILQNAYGYGLFTGGLGIHYGAERLGATCIPISGGNTQKQIMIMQDFGSTMISCTPSYSLYIAEVAEEMGVDFQSLPLKNGMFGAEPWSNNMRIEIEKKLHINAYDIYGLSEIIGPGVSSECEAQNGLHIFDDHFYPEIIDSDTGEVLPYGEQGELVFTTLTKQAFPVIRYRTKDITRLYTEKCSCGRTHYRMERTTGRSDDMIIIRGVNVFPSQIESILLEIEEAEPHYQLVVNKKGVMDELEVHIEVQENFFSDEIKKLELLERKVRNEIESVVGITTRIKLVEPKTIERSMGKAKRVIDLRKE